MMERRTAPDSERRRPAMPSACVSGGCGGRAPVSPSPIDVVEVRVNGVEVAAEAIAREMQHHAAPDAASAWGEAARALAVRELLLQEARRLGLEAEPEEDEAGRLESEDDALITMLLDMQVEPERPSDVECRRYYDARVGRFHTPDLFEAAHILIAPTGDDSAAWNVAEQRARDIARAVGDDPAAFARAARTHSSCASAQQDGSLGQVRRGELVAQIQAALEQLDDASTGRDPVRSQFGWHVLRLQRRIAGRALPFELVRDRISKMLEARSWTVAATRYVVSLAKSSQIQGIAIGADD